MASAKNAVISGDYNGKLLTCTKDQIGIFVGVFKKDIEISKKTIESYEEISAMGENRKSATSGVIRGVVGGALLGPIGALAGGLSAKTAAIYQVMIYFKDGKSSLLEMDDKYYTALVRELGTLRRVKETPVVNAVQQLSTADEIRKYKDLLDSGAITEEEYITLKQKLLAL